MITIRLKNVDSFKNGVNFDSYIKSYFASFAFEGWPYITGGSGQFEGDQLILLDNIAGRGTRTIVMDGNSFSYNLASHVMSGTLRTIKLATLGDSYRADGSFTKDGSGHIVNVSAPVEMTGLSIANRDGVKGEFHTLTVGLMGGVSDGRKADASVLKSVLESEATRLVGSSGNDKFTGTKFSDDLRGGAGHDTLNGGSGNDKIYGEKGKDKIHGDAGADRISGGADADVFIFKSLKDSTAKTSGRDTISDFSTTQNDRLDLSSIDADMKNGGNQAFSFTGDSGFHRKAGELRWEKKGAHTYVHGDVDGDGVGDFAIHLKGAISLTKGDFFL